LPSKLPRFLAFANATLTDVARTVGRDERTLLA
jgi:hypothetical protein